MKECGGVNGEMGIDSGDRWGGREWAKKKENDRVTERVNMAVNNCTMLETIFSRLNIYIYLFNYYEFHVEKSWTMSVVYFVRTVWRRALVSYNTRNRIPGNRRDVPEGEKLDQVRTKWNVRAHPADYFIHCSRGSRRKLLSCITLPDLLRWPRRWNPIKSQTMAATVAGNVYTISIYYSLAASIHWHNTTPPTRTLVHEPFDRPSMPSPRRFAHHAPARAPDR